MQMMLRLIAKKIEEHYLYFCRITIPDLLVYMITTGWGFFAAEING